MTINSNFNHCRLRMIRFKLFFLAGLGVVSCGQLIINLLGLG
ncbi:MAG: hypothetical protein AAF702_31420 [Chloroflexota bacterium]